MLSGCAGKSFISPHFELYHPEKIAIAPMIVQSEEKYRYIEVYLKKLIEENLYEKGYAVSNLAVDGIVIFTDKGYYLKKIDHQYPDSTEFILIIRINDVRTDYEFVSDIEFIYGTANVRSYTTASAMVSISGILMHRIDLLELWRNEIKERSVFSGSDLSLGIAEVYKKSALINAAEISVEKLLEKFPQCGRR
jgi:hypothetical protein